MTYLVPDPDPVDRWFSFPCPTPPGRTLDSPSRRRDTSGPTPVVCESVTVGNYPISVDKVDGDETLPHSARNTLSVPPPVSNVRFRVTGPKLRVEMVETTDMLPPKT